MYHPYFDIREKLGAPKWHDANGVPRYCDYHPSAGGIYDKWAALLEIRCQGCGERFFVSDSYSPIDRIRDIMQQGGDPHVEILPAPEFPSADNYGGAFSYGDAPWHGEHQCSGTTMSTDTVRVVEFWTRDGGSGGYEWQRRPEYEFVYPYDCDDEAHPAATSTDGTAE